MRTAYQNHDQWRHDYGAPPIPLASEVAGRYLEPFLTPWLYGPATPPTPGHPDWVVTPVPRG